MIVSQPIKAKLVACTGAGRADARVAPARVPLHVAAGVGRRRARARARHALHVDRSGSCLCPTSSDTGTRRASAEAALDLASHGNRFRGSVLLKLPI